MAWSASDSFCSALRASFSSTATWSAPNVALNRRISTSCSVDQSSRRSSIDSSAESAIGSSGAPSSASRYASAAPSRSLSIPRRSSPTRDHNAARARGSSVMRARSPSAAAISCTLPAASCRRLSSDSASASPSSSARSFCSDANRVCHARGAAALVQPRGLHQPGAPGLGIQLGLGALGQDRSQPLLVAGRPIQPFQRLQRVDVLLVAFQHLAVQTLGRRRIAPFGVEPGSPQRSSRAESGSASPIAASIRAASSRGSLAAPRSVPGRPAPRRHRLFLQGTAQGIQRQGRAADLIGGDLGESCAASARARRGRREAAGAVRKGRSAR
jgi:hypothetical protein